MTSPLARREFLKTIGCGAAAVALAPLVGAAGGEGANNRPNVLFIAVDDLRPELGCYGSRHIRTPNIDKLAKSARLFKRHYIQSDLCGLKAPTDLPGVSLKPILGDPTRRVKDGAFSFFGRGRYFGRTLRTDRYRIVEWSDSRKKLPAKIELYDHQTDPGENTNIAGNGENKELVQKLLAQMKIPSRAVATRLP